MCDSSRPISKNQIRRLGSRLRNAEVPSEEDVFAYIAWSQGFRAALDEVEGAVRTQVRHLAQERGYEFSARIKQIASARAKLIRQRTSLSDVEDIAGCRVIVPALVDVEHVTLECAKLDVTRTRDYRDKERNGYRAVHLTLRASDGNLVELQIRTRIQHGWAQLTERAAAVAGIEVKYGGGPSDIRTLLDIFSKMVRLTDLRDYDLRAGAVFEDIVAGQVDDAELRAVQSYREKLEADVTEQEASLLRLWATLFTEPGGTR